MELHGEQGLSRKQRSVHEKRQGQAGQAGQADERCGAQRKTVPPGTAGRRARNAERGEV